MQVIPKSNKAHGACSLEDPQPKLLPVIKILDSLKGLLFNIKSLIIQVKDHTLLGMKEDL